MDVTEERTKVRQQLVDALYADAVGPFEGRDTIETSAEVLPIAPSRWYLTGFLAPSDDRDTEDPTAEDEVGAGSDVLEEENPAQGQDPEPKQKKLFPASMGMSVLLPKDGAAVIRATLGYAEYARERKKDERTYVWRRVPRPRVTVEIPLNEEAIETGVAVEGALGVAIKGKLETLLTPEQQGLPKGTRALSLFVVNQRGEESVKAFRDQQFLFQVELELHYPEGFIARPNRRGEDTDDWDERVSDVQYRGRAEYAVGHNASIDLVDTSDAVTTLRTTWIPCATVPRVAAPAVEGVEVRMFALAELNDATSVDTALAALPAEYSKWIAQQRKVELDSDKRNRVRDELMQGAEAAEARIRDGIETLKSDPQALASFKLMNRAMAMAAQQRNPTESWAKDPKWRLFQLAFVLLNVSCVVNPAHKDRENVELIFFPTGGGKTEAYLGLIGFTLLQRRLSGQSRPDQGLGVAVLLRYTLRLLTLDQLGRAATLMCALELLRQENTKELGDVRFAVGLWVGRSATANRIGDVNEAIQNYKADRAGSPFPLPDCPWCLTKLGKSSLTVRKGQHPGVLVTCNNYRGESPCAFSARNNKDGLPVLFVDEQVYRELPCFIVATVDKFALMPWRGETGMLFGRVNGREGNNFFGPMDSKVKGAQPLPEGLRPPELIVQDELHLISGPLGTMVGLYETAIEMLCSYQDEGRNVVPKVVASTATVRRAEHQIRALYGREDMSIFPPPGIDEFETFFSVVDRKTPGRMYAGLAAPGRSMKAILIRAYASLMSAASKLYSGEAKPIADPYMTLAGYFNSLRALGGMRRLVEDDVRSQCARRFDRMPIDWSDERRRSPWYTKRELREPVELTSRESTEKVKETKNRVEQAYDEGHVDVLLASNMISVGVDIDRLGLMVMAGQPKTTSEYIQASSRVGRPGDLPGLVLTGFNVGKPRDRSHFERFTAYHESFYRSVEAQSITPFSGPALDRGITGALLSIARLYDPEMTAPRAAMTLAGKRKLVEAAVSALPLRAAVAGPSGGSAKAEVHKRCVKILDAWEKLIHSAEEGGTTRSYSPWDRDKAGKPILRQVLEVDPYEDSDAKKFVAPTSMRDVEKAAHVWVKRVTLGRGR